MQPKELCLYMTRTSERYMKLKGVFDNFCQFATTQLTSENCTVKGISFLPTLEKNYFDVSFVGKTVRFSFALVEDESPSLLGLVKCNPMGMNEKPIDIVVGEFSFNRQAETNLMTLDGDPLEIDTEWGAGYLVLHLLNEALKKMTERMGAANRP